jgi:molybdenum cofactor biosynthesis enzyme MoaA
VDRHLIKQIILSYVESKCIENVRVRKPMFSKKIIVDITIKCPLNDKEVKDILDFFRGLGYSVEVKPSRRTFMVILR